MLHRFIFLWIVVLTSLLAPELSADQPALTSLDNPGVKFLTPQTHYVVLRRGDLEAVIADNAAVQNNVLPDHKSGYSGVALLRHAARRENLFVPTVSGLNFEHIHDGTKHPRPILFETRNAPMELRLVDEFTVDLYQPPTPTWGLESCHRYHLLEDGTIELTFECIPRRETFRNGYVGLFWASYIHQPESLDIHFRGRDNNESTGNHWIRGISPAHGTRATHLGIDDNRQFPHDADFPLSLVFNLSDHRYFEPWYFGVSHGLAYVQMFRPQDSIRLSQSPDGAGKGNPAWDFQFLIPNYKVGIRYQFVMRAMYLPFESFEQVERASERNRNELGQDSKTSLN